MLQLFRNISVGKIILHMFLIGIVMFLSYWCILAVSEGAIENKALIFVAEVFSYLVYLFAFPSIYFLYWFDALDPGTIIIGCFANCLFYAFLTERVLYNIHLRRTQKE